MLRSESARRQHARISPSCGNGCARKMRFFRVSIIAGLELALGAVLGCGKRAEPPGALAAAGGANAVEGRVVGSAVATEVADVPSTGVSAPRKAAAAGSAGPGGGGSLDIG